MSSSESAERDAEAWLARLEAMRRSVDLRLDDEGRWYHDGEPFTHAGLIAAFDRGIDVHPDSGEPILRVGQRWCYIRADDTPFVARRIDADGGRLFLRLNNGERVAVPEGGFEARGERVYVDLDARRRVRLGRQAQARLGAWLQGADDGLMVVVGDAAYPVRMTEAAG